MAARKTAKRTQEKPFDKLTPAQKRVRIARDVLAQLASGKFIATQGLYVNGPEIEGAKAKASLQTLFKKQKSCEVCALGSMFVALSEDEKTACTFWGFGRDDCTDYLGKFFDQEQLDKIEDAFEEGDVSGMPFASEAEAEDRMRLIMENIVVNGGKFDPSKQPEETVLFVTPGFKG
jgi:hypothetical protein